MTDDRGDAEDRVREHYREELEDINASLVDLANAVGSAMSTATTALLDADVAVADLVIAGDDHIDAARESIEKDWPHGIESAIDVTLLGRYYERFADHAVSVARRVGYLVTGERQLKPTA